MVSPADKAQKSQLVIAGNMATKKEIIPAGRSSKADL
jgi:hypothetical protein